MASSVGLIGLDGSRMPVAVNRTLFLIAEHATVRPSTWDRDVKGRPESSGASVQSHENTSSETAEKPLLERALELWPQLNKVVKRY